MNFVVPDTQICEAGVVSILVAGVNPVCMKKLNLVGRQIGRLRYDRGMTRRILSNMLQNAG